MVITDVLRKALIEADPLYPVAQATGISYSILYRFSNAERDITLGTADKLAEYFRLELRPLKSNRKRRRKRL